MCRPVQNLKRVNDWVDSDGKCLFGDDYAYTWLFPANGNCTGSDPSLICFPYTVCEDFDLVAAGVARPLGPAFALAFWADENKDKSLLCLKARGSKIFSDEELGDGTTLAKINGHNALLLFDTDSITGKNPNELKTPGAYFSNGGIFEYIVDEAGDTNVIKATGSFLDVCAEIKASLSGDGTTTEATHPSSTEASTTTEAPPTTTDSMTTTEAPPATTTKTPEDECAHYDNKGQCEKAGCHWNKKNDPKCSDGGESYKALSGKVEEAATKEQPSTGYAVVAVSAWAIVPMLVLLWNNLSL